MEIVGSNTVAVPRERVWQLLTDHRVLARIIPGVTRLEPDGDGRFLGTLKLGFGPLRGSFEGVLEISEAVAPEAMTLDVEGGGGPGNVSARGTIRLEESGAGTTIHYRGDSRLRGRVAWLGSRLLRGVARQLATSFFRRLEREA